MWGCIDEEFSTQGCIYLLWCTGRDIRGVRAALSYRSSNNISQNKKSIPPVPGSSYLEIKEKNKVMLKQWGERNRHAKGTWSTSTAEVDLIWANINEFLSHQKSSGLPTHFSKATICFRAARSFGFSKLLSFSPSYPFFTLLKYNHIGIVI